MVSNIWQMFEILNIVYRQHLTYQSQPLPGPKRSNYCFAAIPLDVSLWLPNKHLMTPWFLPDNLSTPAWWHLEDFLMNVQWMSWFNWNNTTSSVALIMCHLVSRRKQSKIFFLSFACLCLASRKKQCKGTVDWPSRVQITNMVGPFWLSAGS